MATNRHLNAKDTVARVLTVCAALAALTIPLLTASAPATPAQPSWMKGLDSDELDLVGFAGRAPDSKKPKLTASFPRESYTRGTRAQLVITDQADNVSVQIFRAGGESEKTLPNDVMLGTPVGPAVRVGAVNGRRIVPVTVGAWPSGVYYAQLTSGARVGYAPFVLRPVRLGEHRVAVVMPTQTWQAYNFRDDNGDGVPDTWYSFRPGHTTAQLGRPFLDRGVPPHWKQYDAPFVRWLVQTHKDVDYLSDADLRTASSGHRLANAYSLIIFSGHHEYVTKHEYDVVTQYRNLGGNLMFLAANNFFWKVTLRGNVMTRVAQWRDLGRPEAALIGVQYRGNDRGTHRGPWIVRDTSSEPWLFANTDIHKGDDFSSGGIEIDKTAPSSPAGLKVLAEIPNLFGPGFTAQMTYYETRAGAKVFAAGAFSLADSIWQAEVRQIVENLWDRLATGDNSGSNRRELASASASLSSKVVAPSYGYPVKPFHEQHPIRGFFGDPRIGLGHDGETVRQFHFGVDVSAPNGTPIYATLTGTISLLHPDVVAISSGGVQFSYWHIIPTVHGGEHAVAYTTVIGRIEKPWAHVHFSEARYGRYVNPLRPGAMGPFTDSTTPAVKSLEVEHERRPRTLNAVTGTVDLVVETSDEPPLAVPAPWQGLPAMPALIRWRIVGVTPWATAVDFRETIPSAGAFSSVFAQWTRQNHANHPGRYRIYLVHGWNAGDVQDGAYKVEVQATDIRGNTAHFASMIKVANL